MTDKMCETCRWWKASGVGAVGYGATDVHGKALETVTPLGYCEPDYRAAPGVWKGLVGHNYSCLEHKDKPDD